MAYNFFSQMQGPSIPVNLFADNYSKGVGVADATNPYVQAVEGVMKGIEQGQTIVANDQNAEIRQNQIDRLPVTNAIQDENLAQERQTTQLNDLKLKVAQGTEEETLAAEKAKLSEEAYRLDQLKAIREKSAQFSQAYQEAATPELKKQLIFSGQYNDVFAANPSLYKQAVTNPAVFNTFKPEEQQAISLNIGKREVKDSVQAAAQKDQPAFLQAQENWKNSSLQKDLAVATGINDPVALAKKVEIVPTGYYEIGDDGKIATNAPGFTGVPGRSVRDYKRNPNYDPNLKTYEAIIDGRRVLGGIDPTEQKIATTLKSKLPLHDGTVLQQQTQSLEGRAKAASQQSRQATASAQQNTDTSPETQAREKSFGLGQTEETPSTEEAPITQEQATVQEAFNLTKADVIPLREPLDSLKNLAKQYVVNPSFRDSTALETSKTQIINDLSDTVAGLEFDKSPVLKSKYTQEKVDQYNKSIESFQNGSFIDVGFSTEWMNALKISDPKGLYLKDRKPALILQFNGLYQKLLIQENKRQNLPTNQAQSAKSTNDFLASIRAR